MSGSADNVQDGIAIAREIEEVIEEFGSVDEVAEAIFGILDHDDPQKPADEFMSLLMDLAAENVAVMVELSEAPEYYFAPIVKDLCILSSTSFHAALALGIAVERRRANVALGTVMGVRE